MIYGIGVDCVKIERMEKSMTKRHFVQRVFSESEQALLAGIAVEGKRWETAAACFAAKEAFLKAVGTGIGGFALGDISALRRENGAPYYAFSGSAAAFCAEKGITAHLSLTHEDGLAVAMTVLEVCG